MNTFTADGVAYRGQSILGIAQNGTVLWKKSVEDTVLAGIYLSDGAYFDTGYYPVPNATDITCEFTLETETWAVGIFGCRETSVASASVFNTFYNINPGIIRLDILGASSYSASTGFYSGDAVQFRYSSQSNKATVNGVDYTSTIQKTSTRLDYSFYVGTFNNIGAPYTACDQIVSYFCINEWVNGESIPQRSYIPVRRASDDVVCLKDTLTGTYIEAVTGTVTAIEQVPVENAVTFASDTPFTITTTKNWDGTLYYNTDTLNWNEYDGGTIQSGAGNCIYMRGESNSVISNGEAWQFEDATNLAVTGNLNLLLEYTSPPTTLAGGCYAGMFYGCTSLIEPPELPATTLAVSCYYYMFYGCTSLIEPPELPATTLAVSCYYYMFYGCTSLSTAPELPATTLAESCYRAMFYGCTSLIEPPELPATTLAVSCYQAMFYGCTSLMTAPELPVTTLAESCYRAMFYGCTSLTTPPALPATITIPYCYYWMFYKCTNLNRINALPATVLSNFCYYYMYYGCNNLYVSDSGSHEWRIPTSGDINDDVVPSNWNTSMLSGTMGLFNYSGNPSFNTTYYTNRAPIGSDIVATAYSAEVATLGIMPANTEAENIAILNEMGVEV